MTALTLLAVLALGAVLGIAVTHDPAGSSQETPAAAPPAPPAPGGMNDQLRPTASSPLDPSNRSDAEAAVKNNWPLIANDEFDGTSLNRNLWSPYTGETTGGVGRHKAENISVGDGKLTLTSRGKTSAGMAWREGQQYGRWEVRAKTNKGSGYGDVILLWPDAEDWPEGGEINFMEVRRGTARSRT